MSRKDLEDAVALATTNLNAAVAALASFDQLAENNVFETLEKAEYAVEAILEQRASADCEGSYNCGHEQYSQEFIVGDKKYIGTLTVEYNRHDKTYYYVDGTEFSVKELT